jgi:hypothetical protein
MHNLMTRTVAAARVAAIAALAIAAAQAEAAKRFDLAIDGGPRITFRIDEPVTPDWSNSDSFEIGGLTGAITEGDDTTDAGIRLFFYSADWNGGFDLTSSRGDELGFFGPQIYSGSTAAPVFSAGVYALESASLTISEIAPVAEPGEWAMLATGLSLVGFAARRRKGA